MTQRGIYSELKPAWWYAREGKLPDAPKQVQFVLSDLCQQSCRWCAYRSPGYTSNELFVGDSEVASFGENNPVRWVDTERALTLLEEFKEVGVLAVQFTGGGEPTVHPDHIKIFEKCLSLGLRASLVSNGIRWERQLIEGILPRFDWVRVSIDAGNADSYARIRRVPQGHWDKAWKHIGALVDAIKVQQSQTVLGVGFVVTPESWSEIWECAATADMVGVQNLRLTAMFSTEDEKPYAGIYDEIRKEIQTARDMVENIVIHDNFGSRLDDLKQHSPDYKRCPYQYYTSYVGGDLNNYMCCVYAYNKRGLMTNLKEKSFADWWRSDERKRFMEDFDSRGCERCQFNSKNRAVNYLINDDVPHKEWT